MISSAASQIEISALKNFFTPSLSPKKCAANNLTTCLFLAAANNIKTTIVDDGVSATEPDLGAVIHFLSFFLEN